MGQYIDKVKLTEIRTASGKSRRFRRRSTETTSKQLA